MTTRSGLSLRSRTTVCPPTPEADRTPSGNPRPVSTPISVSQAVSKARQCFEEHQADLMDTEEDDMGMVTNTITHRIKIPFKQIQKDGQWSCDHCRKDLATEKESIGCDSEACDRWFHPSCLTDKTYLNKSKWYCHLCPNTTTDHATDKVVDETKEEQNSTNNSCPADLAHVYLPDPEQSLSSIDEAVWGNLKGIEITHGVRFC